MKLPNRKPKITTVPQKKILLMGHVDGNGGAQRAYQELCNFILNKGYDVRIISITNQSREEQPFGNRISLGRVAHKGHPSIVFKKIYNLLVAGIRARQFNPDIFVSVGLSNSANFVAKLLGDKCFSFAQDFIAKRKTNDALWNSSKKTMDAIALQSPVMLTYCKEAHFNLKGVSWLPCFPAPPTENIIHPNYNTEKQYVKFGYFGRLASNKGLSLLLEAFSDPRLPNEVVLDLWGDGEEKKKLQKLSAQFKIEDRVRFLGAYPANKEGALLMISYDFLVLCSTDNEGLPLVLLESMAYGLPFLATDVGAIRDCCVNNPDSVLVDATKEAIVLGLLQMIKRVKAGDFDPGRLKHFYENNFSYDVMARQWEKCLENPKLFFNEIQ